MISAILISVLTIGVAVVLTQDGPWYAAAFLWAIVVIGLVKGLVGGSSD